MRLLKDRWLGRRTVLRGAGMALALPWLEAMSSRKRAHAAGPRRFLAWFTPNGTIKEDWLPPAGATETEWSLSRILKPLEALKGQLIQIEGIDNFAARQNGPGDGHMRGMGCMLTGADLLPGRTIGGSGTPAGLAAGISVDQEIVAKTKPNTRLPSLELGVQAGSQGTVWGYSSYKGPGLALPPNNNPVTVWNRVFGEVGANATDMTLLLRTRAQRKSVIDAVNANYRLMAAKVGAEDKKRLEQHMTNVSELGTRLLSATVAPLSKTCVRPDVPAKFDYAANDKFPDLGKLQMDLLAMALICDVTRVGTLQWEHSVGDVRFTWLGAQRGHHSMSHDPDPATDTATGILTKELLTKINVWFMEQLASFAGKLAAVQDEGGGSVLDNTMLFATNELSRGNVHSQDKMPFLILGKAGGKLRTNRFLKFPNGTRHNDLLTAFLNVFDVPATTFGKPEWCTAPLKGLT